MSIPSIPTYNKLATSSPIPIGKKPGPNLVSTTYTIANGDDDGYTESNSTSSSSVQFNGSLLKSVTRVQVGAEDDEGAIKHNVGYFRFNNIAIDQGATVQSATFKLIRRGINSGANKNFEIAGRDVDNAGVPSSASTLGSNRTTARVTLTKSTIVNTANSSVIDIPDIKTIIQEIVDRAGWSSGNSIVLVVYTPSQSVSNPIVARFGSKSGADESAQLEITV